MFEELVVFPGDERLGRQGMESVEDTLKMTFESFCIAAKDFSGSRVLLRDQRGVGPSEGEVLV